MTADAVAGYLDALEAPGRSKATVRKERAALNRLTHHLQLIGAIEQTTALDILDVEASTQSGQPRMRPALDEATWRRAHVVSDAPVVLPELLTIRVVDVVQVMVKRAMEIEGPVVVGDVEPDWQDRDQDARLAIATLR
jgi:hypothetical protein